MRIPVWHANRIPIERDIFVVSHTLGIAQRMAETLFDEFEFFRQNEAELANLSAGKFVLIKGQQLVGVFERQYDAIAEAYRRFGNVPFLVKQVIAR